MNITVERCWIASSNAEWGANLPTGWARGGSLAKALARAAEAIDEAAGATITVLPDTTVEQSRAAHKAFFG